MARRNLPGIFSILVVATHHEKRNHARAISRYFHLTDRQKPDERDNVPAISQQRLKSANYQVFFLSMARVAHWQHPVRQFGPIPNNSERKFAWPVLSGAPFP